MAVGYALAVTNPCCGNIGGGGFATLHLADGRDLFLNFRETAPLAATRDMYLDDKGEVVEGLSLKGYLAVAVPGTVMGLDTLLARYGTLPRDKVMAPAIRLAEEGFILTQGDADILNGSSKAFAEQPNIAEIFGNGGKPWMAGDRLIQAKLAATLKRIAADGRMRSTRGRSPMRSSAPAAPMAGFSRRRTSSPTAWSRPSRRAAATRATN